MACSIRSMRRDDIDQLIELKYRSLRSDPDAFYHSEGEICDNQWRSFLINKDSTYTICAEDADNLVGYASLQKYSFVKARHKLKLVFLYVEPSKRRVGIGSKIMSSIVLHADMLQMQITLTLSANNTSAQNLYRRYDFFKFGEEPSSLYIENGVLDNEVYMKRFPK